MYQQQRIRSIKILLQRIKDVQDKTGFELWPANERYWHLLKEEKEEVEAPSSENPEGGTIYEADGCEVVDNIEQQRVQILFPGKPSAEIISYLKSNGFRWSPFNKAWQRQNTPEGRRKALEFAKKFFPKEEKEVEETKEEIKEDNNKLQQDDKGYTFGDESTISDDFPKIYIPQDKEHLESDYLKIRDVNPEYTINPAYNGEHHTMPVLFVRDYKHHSAVDAVDFRFMGHGYNLVIATVNKKHLTLQVKCDVLDIYKKYIVMLAKSINEKRIAKGLKPMDIPDEYKQFDKDRIHKNKQLQLAKAKMKMAAARLKLINMGMGDINYEMD